MRSRRRFLFGAALVGGAYIAYTVYRQQRQLQELFSELFGVATVVGRVGGAARLASTSLRRSVSASEC